MFDKTLCTLCKCITYMQKIWKTCKKTILRLSKLLVKVIWIILLILIVKRRYIETPNYNRLIK